MGLCTSCEIDECQNNHKYIYYQTQSAPYNKKANYTYNERRYDFPPPPYNPSRDKPPPYNPSYQPQD